ncbi:MAG: methylmalonyl Co-A mutase-associated GTPase MeaB [Bacteroidales bacterium]|nr:methylmalonyl Co-A mutase-associated GTPase MeaB [Bacteroidales bacterium]
MEHHENKEEFKHLKVNKGVKETKSVNPNLKKIKRKTLSAEDLFKQIIAGDMPALSRSITLIESAHEKHQQLAKEIINLCLPYSGKARRIGITGVPGVGKSTFIEAFGLELTKAGHKLAILAIDPSSERSKGSILGDKTRMEELVKTPNVFIRPSPSSGTLGGVARKTRESIILCEVAGFETILIETVGVGQSEVAVHSMTDFFLLLMLSGAGDELQGIKRGIMEMADTIAITKADNDNILKAKTAASEYKNALHLLPSNSKEWETKVYTCSSVTKEGIAEISNTISDFFILGKSNGSIATKRSQQALYWLKESIKEHLNYSLFRNESISMLIEDLQKHVENMEINPFDAADQIFKAYIEAIKQSS